MYLLDDDSSSLGRILVAKSKSCCWIANGVMYLAQKNEEVVETIV